MKSIITIIILVAGTLLIVWALPQDHLVSVIEEKEQETEIQEQDPVSEKPDIDYKERTPNREICVGEYCDGHMSGEDDFTVVHVPLLSEGGEIGCGDDIFLAPHTVKPKTTAVLDATYQTLFELKPDPEIEADNIRNVVGTETQLWYDGVILKDGLASLYLTGRTQNIVHCSVPAFRAQIEQAAFQFESVDSIEVYINDEKWDWCDYSEADPQESGCDTAPKYWVTEK